MQSFLPYLWRDGHLQGRTFDVLMTGLPAATLHQRLDGALAAHPESPTLGDFRASESRLTDELEALIQARKLVTPHSEIAHLFSDKTELLNWIVPDENPLPRPATRQNSIAFPASTLGRKGVYQLREALRSSNVELILCGPILEEENFWQGFNSRRCINNDWLNATAVVLPSIVESKPRKLLQAVAAGVPVIASAACGLTHVKSVTTIPTGDVDALRKALFSVIS
jgi:glycosyltransferase involved in cell wall biosynthesis